MQINGTPNEQQRTEGWVSERLGKFSCSQFYRLMTEPKLKADKEAGNLSDGAMTYVYECLAERLTGHKAKEEFTSKYTEWGIDTEPIAKAIYEEVFEVVVSNRGYIPYSDDAGGSPDGEVGDDGLIEIKCPYTITAHLEHKLKPLKDKTEYFWQCLGYLLITNRKWIDFISYHPAYPGKLQLVKQRILADDYQPELLRLKNKLNKATEVLNNLIKQL